MHYLLSMSSRKYLGMPDMPTNRRWFVGIQHLMEPILLVLVCSLHNQRQS